MVIRLLIKKKKKRNSLRFHHHFHVNVEMPRTLSRFRCKWYYIWYWPIAAQVSIVHPCLIQPCSVSFVFFGLGQQCSTFWPPGSSRTLPTSCRVQDLIWAALPLLHAPDLAHGAMCPPTRLRLGPEIFQLQWQLTPLPLPQPQIFRSLRSPVAWWHGFTGQGLSTPGLGCSAFKALHWGGNTMRPARVERLGENLFFRVFNFCSKRAQLAVHFSLLYSFCTIL